MKTDGKSRYLTKKNKVALYISLMERAITHCTATTSVTQMPGKAIQMLIANNSLNTEKY